MSISFDLTAVSSNKVAALFERFPAVARREIEEAMGAITQELEELVKAAEPSRTGALRAATTGYVTNERDKVAGRVTIEGPSASKIFGKAAALEYGAHGTAKVRQHERRVSTVFGKLVEPTTQIISAYTRQVDIAEHEFLRGPLESRQSAILAQLREALDAAVAGAEA